MPGGPAVNQSVQRVAMIVEIEVNGRQLALDVPPDRRLLDVLREDLHLTGTKEGCGKGGCGACTVLLNGRPVTSCLLLACQVQHARIMTVEGLAANGSLHVLQHALLQAGAVQCGFCTPGMLMSLHALLAERPQPNEDEIRAAIAGNLCRCTGYTSIVRAVQIMTAEEP